MKKVIVGMSGGVDSSVTAALLKERGFDVRGVYMKNWADPEWPCPWQEERHDAMAVAAKLDIPCETWDFSKEYYEAVTEYMIREYKEGRTPNPDVMCNREIKFGVFLNRALKEGADFVATGHYVRKIGNKLFQAKDLNKDQSYFLWTLTPHEVEHSLFPIGEYTKPEVRELARKFGLPTAEKKDSQGICFVGEIPVKEFLQSKIPVRAGEIITTDGEVIGTHEGVQYFTIGQRHGIGVPGGGVPLYVVEKDYAKNQLIVGGEASPKLYSKEFSVHDVSWVAGQQPEFPVKAFVRTRYRAPLQECEINAASQRMLSVVCKNPERAVTPGQSVVFYALDGEMLGGGIIN
jgi:tRNA-specific 2-thiouridylase